MKRLMIHVAKIAGWSVACFAVFFVALMLYLQWDFRKRPSAAAEVTYQVCVKIADAYYAPPKAMAHWYQGASGRHTLTGLGSPEAWLIPWTLLLGTMLHGAKTLVKNMLQKRSSQHPAAPYSEPAARSPQG